MSLKKINRLERKLNIDTAPTYIKKFHRQYTKHIYIYNDRVSLKYENLPSYHWELIKNAAIKLSDTGLGPKIYKLEDHNRFILMEKLLMFSHNIYTYEHLPSSKHIKARISEHIDKLHEHNYVHRDTYM